MPDAAAAVFQTESPYRANDGAILHGYRWTSRETDASAKAIVVIMHGYGEHCGRYRELAEFLVHAGYVAAGFDARGHGQSPGQRGHIAHFERYVDDLQGFLDDQRRLHPGLPLMLLGHSNGGLISLRTVQTRTPLPDGLILTSPLVALQPAHQPVPRWAAVVLSAFASRLPLPNGLDRDELSHDPKILEAHRRDKLCHGRSTPAWYVAATGAMQQVFANLDRIRLPVLAIEADTDPIVVPQAITQLYEGIASADKELVVCKNAFHEVLNEVGREDTYRRIVGWLAKHLSSRAAA
jgi:alpha-beta hydrolase superfamily lysophospholipase